MTPDAWDAFPDAEPAAGADPWASFPDAQPAPEPRKKARKPFPKAPALPAGSPLPAPVAYDGDTVRSGDNRVRVWGADAPELAQSGYKPDGSTVPLGEQSRAFLQNEVLGSGDATFGTPQKPSFGRPVGSVNVEGTDAAQALIRSGNALAAPEYLADDSERRFDYTQAERIARQNRLGVHGVGTLTPREFRMDKDMLTPTQLVNRFRDQPTPFAGLRPEIETGIMERTYDASVPIADVVAYGKEHGLIVAPDSVKASREHFLKHGEVGGVEHTEPTVRPLTDLGDGKTGAGARGFVDGFVANGLGELGAFVDSAGGTAGRENIWNSDRRWADIWVNNNDQNTAILGHDSYAFPNTTGGANLAGAVTSGFVIPYGTGARSATQLAKVGGVYGATEGYLGTDGGVADRLTGAAQGAPLGAVLNAAGGKALQAAAPVLSRAMQNVRTNGAADVAAVRNVLGGKRFGNPAAGVDTAPADGLGSRMKGKADEWADFPDAAASDLPGLPRAQAMDDALSGSLSEPLTPPDGFGQPRRLLDPATRADLLSTAARIEPRDMLPLPSNAVDGPEELAAAQAGRFAPAKPFDERQLLTRRKLPANNGGEVPKVGPVDLVGFARLQGGLNDSGDGITRGGDLRSMGFTNQARKDMDFVGQETRFGPLVSDEGQSLDDAAFQAWEAGYFPEHSERPTVNEYLDALRDTYDGQAGRRFHPDDAPELESYYAAQQDRYALEQQQADGPVYNDMSDAGDDAQPFAPPEAYEEWGSTPPDFAGNVRLDKLDSPQDIARALAQTERNVGFDAAKRGTITQAETARLASELNLTPDQLLSRRKGQAFNAEQALAARQILAKSGNELVNAAKAIQRLDNPGDELTAEFRKKWMRHVAIQEQVSGMTAEAGRALQQFRQLADSRAVGGDVLNAMVRGGGGEGNLKEAAEVLLDAVELGPGKFNALAEKAAKPKWRQKIGELYINFLLSNPPTHIVNSVSNTLTAMAQVPEYAAGAAIGAARRAVVGQGAQDRILASEVGARTIGLVQGTKEGARLFAKALRTGDAEDFVTKVEGDEYKAIGGLKGEVIRIPTRLLTAEDEFFKGIARRMEINAQAVRVASKEGLRGEAAKARIAELAANPTDDMMAKALDYGRYLTFQRKLGESGQAISNFTNTNIVGKIVVPFVRTPINLVKFAAERSPAAPLLREWRRDFMAGGIRRDMAVAKSLLGTGLATVMYQAAQEGTITGALPSDPAKARLMRADGWQPYSIKVGDRYVSYSRLDPFSTTIGVAADMATLQDGMSDRQAENKGMMLVASIMGNLASKTWLSGISGFTEALDDPARYADNWVQRVASSFAVPAGVAGVARAIDPIARKRESVGDAIKARVPGMTGDLLPRRDIFGEAVEMGSIGPDLISPFWESKAKNDPVIAEMLRIGKSVSAPGKSYTEDGERVDFTPEQYDRYHEIAGRLTYNALNDLVRSPAYGAMSDTERRKKAKKVTTDARRTARGVLGDAGYRLPAKGAAGAAGPVSADDPWSGFQDAEPASKGKPAASEWDAFDDVPQRDVMGSLERAIPGVRFTSGYRDEAYQADMRRRGYNPSRNSGHLDGSGLDMVPPPGKSMRWLMARVRELEPDARLLNEGDHLHATFPGWYSAPAIGGARAAGLRNPMAAR